MRRNREVLPLRLVYDHRYDLNLGPHVFPSHKYRMIYDRLLVEQFAALDDFVPPVPALVEDLQLVHGERWITRFMDGTLDHDEIIRLEIPYSAEVVAAFLLATGGSILAARLALKDGVGFNIGGGFHHACRDHGEGFCAIHDLAVAIRRLQKDGLIERAMVIDADVHHGNGTADIFAEDASVFTLSIHQLHNYPDYKPPSSMDVHLRDGAGDAEYLGQLDAACQKALSVFKPQLVMYLAGADPFRDDRLGGLSLTMEGLKDRDRLVFNLARENGWAVAVALAGGYARNVEDTVTIHVNTVKAAVESLGQ